VLEVEVDLTLALTVGLILRLIVRYSGERSLFFNEVADSKRYLEWARAAEGTLPDVASGAYFLGPLYSKLLALFSASTSVILVFQMLVGLGTVACCYLIARRLFGRTAGVAASLLAAVYKPFIFYENLILPETVLVAFCAFAVLAVIIYAESEQILWLAVAGALLGFACLTKGTALSLAMAIGVLIFLGWPKDRAARGTWRERARRTMVFLAPLALALTPAAAHNFSRGEFVLLSANGGLNFYLGNKAGATGGYIKPYWLDISADFTGRHAAERMAGRPMTLAESSHFFLRRGLEEIATKPGRWLKLMAHKLHMAFHAREVPQAENLEYAGELKPVLRWPLPGWAAIFALACAGVAFLCRRRRMAAPLFLLALSFPLVSVLFFVVGRFRLPAAVGLIVLAGIGISGGLDVWRARDYRKAAVVGAVVVIVTLLLVVPYAGSERDLTMARGLRGHGTYYLLHGEFTRAEEIFRQAVEFDSTNPWAFNGIGLALFLRGEYTAAIDSLSRATEMAPKNPTFLAILAVAYMRVGDYARAEEAARRATQIAPEWKKAARVLATAREKLAPAIPIK
jgi:4-amino-4-deoxy-L-arabinose transferase-like glycosyltransferase